MNLVNPTSVTFVFALILAALIYFRPRAGRLVGGVFFLLMALGVNVPIMLSDPTLFAAAGANALLPVYRWFFNDILAVYPLPFVILLILFETTTGLLILSSGRGVRLGVLAAALFCLFIAPVGMEEIASPLIGLAYLLLLRVEFPQPVIPLLRLPLAAGRG